MSEIDKPLENDNLQWDAETRKKFDQMIEKVPIFMRPIAKKQVSKKAENIVRDDKRSVINEKDMVDAFFAATPFGFHGPMMTDMTDLNIDYKKYGHPIDYSNFGK